MKRAEKVTRLVKFLSHECKDLGLDAKNSHQKPEVVVGPLTAAWEGGETGHFLKLITLPASLNQGAEVQ